MIISKEKSVDLYLEEDKLSKWFYGIKYYLKLMNMKHKIISTSNFLLTKLKLKLIFRLKEDYDKNKITSVDYKNLVRSLIEGNVNIYNYF
jgi:hypothetical protein